MSTHFPHRQYAVLAIGIVLALLGAILAVLVLPHRADGATYGYQVTTVDPPGNVSAKTARRTVTMP
ncbi:MAG: hypothetical protein JWM79_3387 [Nocardioides sp.]|nr:hypothetical protein [Nocardioides sp.]